MLKVNPHRDYPPEEGRYVRGNDASPVAVAIILNHDADKIPPEIKILVGTGIESGAALSGTIQTENPGSEKVDCNIVAIPVIGLKRAIAFYTAVIGYQLERVEVDEDKKAMLNTSAEASRMTATFAMAEICCRVF